MKKTTLPALNVQAPWAELIIEGKKSIETRTYPLPGKYVGRELLLIETPGPNGTRCSRIAGVVVFGESFQYVNESQFHQDFERHQVGVGTPFSWKPHKKKWGWPVLKYGRLDLALPRGFRKGIVYSAQVSVQTETLMAARKRLQSNRFPTQLLSRTVD